MSHRVTKGTITSMETGESWVTEHYLFPNDLEMDTIIEVITVKSYVLPDDTFQISVHCHGLDSVGSVFDIGIEFTPDTYAQRDEILQDMKAGSLFLIRGKYLAPGDGSVLISDPMYWPLEPEYSEDEVREVFRFNGNRG